MKIAFFNTKSYDQEYFDKYNTSHQITYFPSPLNDQTAPLATKHQVVCAFVNDNLDSITIKQLSEVGVSLIAMRCAGYNNIDLKAAGEAGIKIVRVPAYSPHAVAEHAIALILTLNRKTHKAYNRVREGNFSLEKLIGFDLYGKTIGIVGTGKIGDVFARIMKGFGCKVIASDIQPNVNLEKEGIIYLKLEDVLAQSDIVSLHCPLLPETYHLINQRTISIMKKGVMLINTGRGALIETQTVIDALKSGQLGYLGIDVYEQEDKFFFKDLSETIIQDDMLMRLMSFPNVLITSHQGFFTEDALIQIALTTLKNISQFENGEPFENQVL